MAMWKVAGELLARGIQVNLAAWYPWQMQFESVPRIDSEAIFIIGPCNGTRMIFDGSILGLDSPARAGTWSNMMHCVRDEQGREPAEPFKLTTFTGKGQGYPLSSYHLH